MAVCRIKTQVKMTKKFRKKNSIFKPFPLYESECDEQDQRDDETLSDSKGKRTSEHCRELVALHYDV